MNDETSILREQIARYQNLLELTPDEWAKTILERLIDETHNRLDAVAASATTSAPADKA